MSSSHSNSSSHNNISANNPYQDEVEDELKESQKSEDEDNADGDNDNMDDNRDNEAYFDETARRRREKTATTPTSFKRKRNCYFMVNSVVLYYVNILWCPDIILRHEVPSKTLSIGTDGTDGKGQVTVGKNGRCLKGMDER